MANHTRTEKIGGNSICFCGHPSRAKNRYDTDNRHQELEFEIGDHVFLKMSYLKGVMRFGKRGKLNPRYIGPFEILRR